MRGSMSGTAIKQYVRKTASTAQKAITVRLIFTNICKYRAPDLRARTWNPRRLLNSVLSQHVDPAILGLQHQFDDLTYRAVPAGRFRDVVRRLLEIAGAVTDSDCEARIAQHRQVGQIVPNEADLLRLQTAL